MLVLNDISFDFGGRYLYRDTSWHIKPNEHIGLIGANGTGKSTLLRVITGEYSLTGGELTGRRNLSIGFLNQDLLSYESENTILHVAMEAFEKENALHDGIEEILKKLETDHSEDILHKLHDLQTEYEHLDGYNIQYKAEAILEGLGFSTKDLQRPLKEFSGGWRMRVMLAKILLKKPDLLLLDEPTNHLDLPSIQWLEEYLREYEGAFIIVSHDRYFLDKTIDITAEIANEKITIYPGNYSFFLEEKAQRQELQHSQFKNQQKYLSEQQKLIDRFRAKASKAKMAQSRIKMLERIERIDDVESDAASIRVRFDLSHQPGKVLFEMKNISKSYPDVKILDHTTFSINRGDKIALIGANGKGKSTLLRIINGTEKFTGERIEGHNVVTSFYAQHQLESLGLSNTMMEELQKHAPEETDGNLRALLGAFLFKGDDVFKKVKVLSGGEKARIALAKTILTKANFLLLDEPTNHLDMKTVNILIDVLEEYEGSYVVISHDRFFVTQVANKIWFIENYQLKEYPGTYDEYELWQERLKTEKREAAKTKTVNEKPQTENKKNDNQKQRDSGKEKQKQLQQLNKQIESLDKELKKLVAEKEKITAELNALTSTNQTEKIKSTQIKFSEVEKLETQMREQWDALFLQQMEMEEGK
jgi:ATP-binding cassette, subfamily F, member 3